MEKKRQIPYNSYAKPDGLIFKSANLSSSSSTDNKSKWPLRTRINDVEEYTIHMVLDGWMNEQMNRLMVWKSVRHEHKHSWIKKKILLHFYLVKNFFFRQWVFFLVIFFFLAPDQSFNQQSIMMECSFIQYESIDWQVVDYNSIKHTYMTIYFVMWFKFYWH